MPTTESANAKKADHNEDIFAGPSWNNSSEYPSISSNEFKHDLVMVDHLIARLKETCAKLAPRLNVTAGVEKDAALIGELQAFSEIKEQVSVLLANLGTYVSCEKCVDSRNAEAQKMASKLNQISADFQTVTTPISLFLRSAPDALIENYLKHPHTESESFSLKQSRVFNDTILSEAEETLLIKLRTDGHLAWGELYNQISGDLRCKVAYPDGTEEEMGLAKASGLLRDASEPLRRASWTAIQEAWKKQEASTAAILNSLAGWRLEETKRRSQKREIDFLTFPLHSSRIQKQTLEAMLEAIRTEIEIPRRALRAIAKGMGKSQIDPWDTLAPAHTKAGANDRREFREGLGLIREAFASVDPDFGDFVKTMEKNRWIEGRVLPTKRQGAFCTRFAKSRSPRVFQTYMGSISDIRTLAHELGHAYHGWVMCDLPPVLHRYPMTLAETASVFAETTFADYMSGQDEAAKFEIAWQNAETAASFLINIPARFEFEKSFYERRQQGFVTPEELNALTDKAWRNWYGDTISQPESQFWMTKLHFSMAGTSFYNYPYAFGYLFSLGIYALRHERGENFLPSYVSLLRDTGRMTAEELAKTHLNEDLTKPDFWRKSLRIVASQVEKFEKLLSEQKTSPTLNH